MNSDRMYPDVTVLGRMDQSLAAQVLRDLGETETADLLALRETSGEQTYAFLGFGGKAERKYAHTAHSFGYIPAGGGGDRISIQSATGMTPDESLLNSRIRITLDGLRAASYPGSGDHRVLFDFYAQNQVSEGVEHLHFNSTLRVTEGESAAIVGYPVFIGLGVPPAGVAFKCLTVNVKNDEDERFLAALESDVFKSGLRLAATLQPAIAPLTGLATALTKSVVARHRNVAVQEFYLGLDFSRVVTGARLREGTYIAVQIPELMSVVWNWDEWMYHPGSGRIVAAADGRSLIPYNYIMLGVSRYEGS